MTWVCPWARYPRGRENWKFCNTWTSSNPALGSLPQYIAQWERVMPSHFHLGHSTPLVPVAPCLQQGRPGQWQWWSFPPELLGSRDRICWSIGGYKAGNCYARGEIWRETLVQRLWVISIEPGRCYGSETFLCTQLMGNYQSWSNCVGTWSSRFVENTILFSRNILLATENASLLLWSST